MERQDGEGGWMEREAQRDKLKMIDNVNRINDNSHHLLSIYSVYDKHHI